MHHIFIGLKTGDGGRMNGRSVTARGLHGFFYDILGRYRPEMGNRLHNHPAPKPYTLAPYFDADGRFMGLRIAVITDEVAEAVLSAWQSAKYDERVGLCLARQPVEIVGVEWVDGPSFLQMSNAPYAPEVRLSFISPTTFKRGHRYSPFPQPVAVFRSLMRVWQAYAPTKLPIPDDWLEWCDDRVSVTCLRLETAVLPFNHKTNIIGFLGDVSYHAHGRKREYIQVWQALAQLAPYSGVGYKTTMGMGAVEVQA